MLDLTETRSLRTGLSAWALAVMPLALAGLLPWWGVALLCVVFGLSGRDVRWAEGRLLVSLLVGGLVVVPELVGVLSRTDGLSMLVFLSFRHLLLLVLIGVLHRAAVLLEEGSLWGVWLTGLVGLFAPQPGLVVALAGAALARAGRDDDSFPLRSPGQAERANVRRYWAWLAAGVLGFTLLTLVLPRYAVNLADAGAGEASGQASRQQENQAAARPPAQGAGGASNAVTRRAIDRLVRVPAPPLELGFVATGALLLLLFVRLLALPGGGRGQRKSLLDVLMILGLVLNVVLIMLLSYGDSAGGADAPAAGNDPAGGNAVQGQQVNVQEVASIMNSLHSIAWVLLVFQLLAVGVGFWFLLRLRFTAQDEEAEVGEPDDLSPVPAAPAAPTHRVRLAYGQATGALLRHGWGRGAAETPGQFAARLARQQPAFAGVLARLTQLYEPVRYGGVVSEDDAAQAEEAARQLTELAARHPRLAVQDDGNLNSGVNA